MTDRERHSPSLQSSGAGHEGACSAWRSGAELGSEAIKVLRRTLKDLRCVLMTLVFVGCLGLSIASAFGQSTSSQRDFESRLADAVRAQSAGDLAASIAAYQSALAIRRDIPEVWANLGLAQHQAGDYAGALLSFRAANQIQPKLFVPILFLGLENLQAGNRMEAIRYLTIARQLHPEDAEVYMNLGRAYFGLKQFENAELAYRRGTELNPKNGEAWYRLGITYLEMSESASGEFVRLNRKSPFFQQLDAESLSEQDKLIEATEAYRRLLSAEDAPRCARSSFGLILLKRGDLSEAQTEFQKDLRSGGCSLAELGSIRLSLEKGEIEAALVSLAQLWKLDSGFVKANASVFAMGMRPEQIVRVDEALGEASLTNLPPEAVSVFRLSLRGAPTMPPQGNAPERRYTGVSPAPNRSEDYYLRGEYGRCVKSLLPTVGSLSRDKLSLLAACSFFSGDFQNALATGKRLRRIYRAEEEGLYWSIRAEQRLAVLSLLYAGEVEPNSIRLHELLAESYRDRGKYGEAEAEYKVALSINPKEFAALIGAAANYLQESRIDLAAEMIQGGLAENPSDPEANYIMGEVLIARHKYAEAEAYLKAGLAGKADLVPRIHVLLGQIYASQGESERAIREFKLGLSSDDDGSVHFQLARLYQKTGESTLAAAAFAESKALARRRQTVAHGIVGEQDKQPNLQP